MGTLSALSIINRVAATLNDPDNQKWPAMELLEYLSDGQRACVLVRPEVNPVTTSVRLVGGTKQEIPEDGFVLLNVVRNMGADGATPGRAITQSDRSTFDQTRPTWHMDDPVAEAVNYTYEIENRETFYVYPAQPADASHIEIVYSRIPDELLAAGNAIEIADVYQPPLISYMLYRAFSKNFGDRDTANTNQKAGTHYDQFAVFLLGRQEVDVRIAPEQLQQKLTD